MNIPIELLIAVLIVMFIVAAVYMLISRTPNQLHSSIDILSNLKNMVS